MDELSRFRLSRRILAKDNRKDNDKERRLFGRASHLLSGSTRRVRRPTKPSIRSVKTARWRLLPLQGHALRDQQDALVSRFCRCRFAGRRDEGEVVRFTERAPTDSNPQSAIVPAPDQLHAEEHRRLLHPQAGGFLRQELTSHQG